jgi:hypothetical protein
MACSSGFAAAAGADDPLIMLRHFPQERGKRRSAISAANLDFLLWLAHQESISLVRSRVPPAGFSREEKSCGVSSDCGFAALCQTRKYP